MPGLRPDVDPDGLLEFSVVYTDRALNHMSQRFQGVMRGLSAVLKEAYAAHAVAVVPGGGTFGMEAVARQFARQRRVLVLRNGWFSYRWSQILDMAELTPPEHQRVLCAQPLDDSPQSAWQPPPLDQVLQAIADHRPEVVFAPHVETSAGMVLPTAYLKAVAAAVHEGGGLMVLDCIASGTVWVDMAEVGIDVLISAPQKGWSASPGAAFVMMSEAAVERLSHTQSNSFAADLKKWWQLMQAYEQGGHLYHATLPTDTLARVLDTMQETRAWGWATAAQAQWDLGSGVRALLADHGFASVAAPGFQAPGVVVSHTTHPDVQSGKAFAALGLQSAAGVPLQCGEGPGFRTFRLGLFGLDKLQHIPRTLQALAPVVAQVSRLSA